MSDKDQVSDNQRLYDILATSSGVLAGILVTKALEKAWRKVKNEDPPADPASEDVSWRDAIGWTLASGVVIGLTKLLVEKGATEGWKKMK